MLGTGELTMPEKEYIEREARYIDANKFIDWLDIGHLRSPSEKCLSELNVKKMIELQPTADVAEVKHGTWEEHDRYVCNSDGEPVVKIGVVFICSECGRQEYQKEPYCHCGAKMDSDSNIECGAKVMLRLCGTEYKYCDGICKNCNEPEYHTTNKIQEEYN